MHACMHAHLITCMHKRDLCGGRMYLSSEWPVCGKCADVMLMVVLTCENSCMETFLPTRIQKIRRYKSIVCDSVQDIAQTGKDDVPSV